MKCRICMQEGNFKIYFFKEMMFGQRDKFEYFECSSCKCLQIKDFPQNIEKYYPDNYYSFSIDPQKNDSWVKKIPIWIRNNYAVYNKYPLLGKFLFDKYPRLDLKALRHLNSLTKSTSILDVGCGDGFCLYELKKMGFENLLGADPYIKNDIEYPNGLKILKSELEGITRTFDVVMMHHVLEHLEDQHNFFKHTHSKLNDGGVFMIRIPIVNYAWRKYGANWAQIDAPRHFFLHSIESIKYLAEKHSFIVENIIFDSNEFQLWGSEQYKKDIPLYNERSHYQYQKNRKSTFTNEEIKRFKEKSIELNESQQGDQAIFILKKSN